MKRFLNCLLSLALVIGFVPTVYANEYDVEHEMTESNLEVDTDYEIVNNTVIEITSFEYDGKSIEMIKTAYQNDYVEVTVKEDNVVVGQDSFYSPDIYIELLSRVPSPISVLASREDLPSTIYKHYFVSSNTETFYEEDISEFLVAGVSLVLLFVSMKYPRFLSADQADLASNILELMAAVNINEQMIITNIYEVKLKEDLSYYGLCYHVNVINYGTGGTNALDSGMYYYQVL